MLKQTLDMEVNAALKRRRCYAGHKRTTAAQQVDKACGKGRPTTRPPALHPVLCLL